MAEEPHGATQTTQSSSVDSAATLNPEASVGAAIDNSAAAIRRSDDNNDDHEAEVEAEASNHALTSSLASSSRGRSSEIKAEDAQFAKKSISPSPTRSSLSAALHAHAPGVSSPMAAGSASPVGRTSTPGSGATTPADLTTEEQLERLRHKVQDLSSQVTSLNGKLVASYNRVGNLEDEADQKVNEIRSLTSKVEKLEAERKEWEDKYEGGLLVEKVRVSMLEAVMRTRRTARALADLYFARRRTMYKPNSLA